MISPAQCRAARAWLRMTQAQLADAAGVNVDTIAKFESGRQRLHPDSEVEVCAAFAENGLRPAFDDDGTPAGIRTIRQERS